MIGGNLATNAGGVRMIKYGSLRGNTVGLKAVLPNGEVIDNMKGLLKDNTGYDLKQFFIGSEGTLGIITQGQILCPVNTQSQSVALLACRDFSKVLNILRRAKKHLGGYLSAIQFFDSYCLDLVMKQMEKPNPIEGGKIYPFYVILEASSSNTSGVDQSLLSSLLETELVQEMEDGILSQDFSQFRQLWEYRESIAQAGKRLGYNYKYDLSLPRAKFYDLVEALRTRCGDKAYTVGYGHIGDGNLHINVVVKGYEDKALQKEVGEIIEPFTFDFIRDERGSISAEHGIGFTKPAYLGHSKSPEAIAMMKTLKAALDPHGIMNPYKLFPVENPQKKRRFE